MRAPTPNGTPLYTLVLLAITTGARKGELIRLMWSDIDLKKGRALVRETKNDEQRTLPLAGKGTGRAAGAQTAEFRAQRARVPAAFGTARPV
jgi:site-specific recombinase XerD